MSKKLLDGLAAGLVAIATGNRVYLAYRNLNDFVFAFWKSP